jgi:hypothetical protein
MQSEKDCAAKLHLYRYDNQWKYSNSEKSEDRTSKKEYHDLQLGRLALRQTPNPFHPSL